MSKVYRTDAPLVFAENLRRLISLHSSPAKLAKKLGVGRQYVYHLQNGQKVPSLRFISRVASALGCDVSEFFSRNNIDA